jgi:hypothetical protein
VTTAGDPVGLAAHLDGVFAGERDVAGAGLSARKDFEERFSAPAHLTALTGVYERLVAR